MRQYPKRILNDVQSRGNVMNIYYNDCTHSLSHSYTITSNLHLYDYFVTSNIILNIIHVEVPINRGT
jgi:hypothetical protein